jgi:hypothetical protein
MFEMPLLIPSPILLSKQDHTKISKVCRWIADYSFLTCVSFIFAQGAKGVKRMAGAMAESFRYFRYDVKTPGGKPPGVDWGT